MREMDKYGIVLDLIEHPDKYTPQQIEILLSDSETRAIYNLLCKTQSSLKSENNDVNVDDEWQSFEREHIKPRLRFLWHGSRAASISALILTSVAAIAIGTVIGISLKSTKQVYIELDKEETSQTAATAKHSGSYLSANTDTLQSVPAPIVFEDETLEAILDTIAALHNLDVKFKTADVARLHLFYKFDPEIPLDETIEQLNSFGQINIKIAGNTLIVD